MPERVQLRRTKGWRKPEGCIGVGRPSRWGNPFRVAFDPEPLVSGGVVVPIPKFIVRQIRIIEAEASVLLFRHMLREGLLPITVEDVQRELAGHDLGCWCHPFAPCHADVLLEVANPGWWWPAT